MDLVDQVAEAITTLSDQSAEYYRRGMADVAALISILIEKDIITQEEWSRKRMQCTAAIDQVIAASQAETVRG